MGAIGNTAHDRRGANNGRASLMEAEVIRIRELASNGMPIENIRPSIGRVDLKWDSIFNAAVGVTWSLIGGAVDPKSLKHATHHGMRSAPEYTSWTGMRARCTNPNVPEFKNYGGRGISVCDRWMNGDGKLSGFECFLSDMGQKPSRGHSIDRYPDNDGDYEPGNCRWATRLEQNKNRRKPTPLKNGDASWR